VTTFTAGPGTPTLPIWIFSNLFRPDQAPVVNVVAVVLVLFSILPIWLAQRLAARMRRSPGSRGTDAKWSACRRPRSSRRGVRGVVMVATVAAAPGLSR
jgi:ABC-type Fe3+ transport system permease subunit